MLITLGGTIALIGVFRVNLGDGPIGDRGMPASAGPPTPTAAATVAPPSAAAPTSAAPTSAPPVLRLTGAVPPSGSGNFRYSAIRGEVLGTAGILRRFRVAAERESGEDIEEFAAAVDLALDDPGSWIGSGQLRLQRVPNGTTHDFTVYLATAETAREMCAVGYVDIRIDGKPYTSCRAPGKVIINLDRWRLSVDHFVAAKVPLATYRLYVINHEVGHELGHGHEQCPGAGQPAPVMMQQTLFLKGCVANPWPYLRGHRYAGPAL